MLAALANKLGMVAGKVVWLALIVIRWAHATFVARPADVYLDLVLGSAEEAVLSAIRSSFAWTARFVNGLAARTVSLFVDRGYYEQLRGGRRRPTAWQRWWAERAHRGTFNAVVERDGLVARSRASPSPTPSPGGPAWADMWTPRGSLPRSSGSYDQLLHGQQQRQTEILLAAERLGADGGGHAPAASRRGWRRFLWPFGGWRSRGHSPEPSPLGVRRSGSELFDRPSGYAVAEAIKRRGLLEDSRMLLELGVATLFDGARALVRAALLLPRRPKWEPAGGGHRPGFDFGFGGWPGGGGERPARPRPRGLRAALARGRRLGVLEDLQVYTASDVVLQAGYPLEEHVVTTDDGYVLHVQRIPRRGSRDAVFFQHGVLDTSLGWVSNGIQGSQAFAAWDQGHDVWLGNARSNPPRMHANPQLGGARFWHYSLNELGTQDIAAQIAHIHAVKTRELRPGSGFGQAGGATELAGGRVAAGLRRTYSDSALAAAHLLRPSPFGELEPGSPERAKPASPAVSPQQLQQSPRQEPSPRRSSASLDGGPELESFRRRMRRLGLRVELPHGGDEPSGMPAAVASARVEGEKTRRHADRRVRVGGDPPAQQQQAPAADTSPDGPDRWFDALDQLPPGEPEEQPERSGSGSCTTNGASSPTRTSGAGRASVPPSRDVDSSTSSSALPAQAAGPTVSRSMSLHGSALEAAGVTPPAVTPRLSAAERQALTPDKIAIRGVERPGETESESGGLLLPAPSTSTRGAATPRLTARGPTPTPAAGSSEPYRLRAVGHSLGGASLLIYAVHCGLLGRPHHLRRLVLLTPAGFHERFPVSAWPFVYLVPPLMAALAAVWPGVGAPVYIPSSLLRYIAFKLTFDLQQIPGLNELTRAAMRLLLSGDSSEWDRALQQPHYNRYGMPALSLHTGAHLIQLIRNRRFRMFDHGSAAANARQYGQYGRDQPIDVAEQYGLLQGLPVDLVAGSADGIIPPSNVQQHYAALRRAGVQVTYKEFRRAGHLDLTFGMREEIRRYVISRLLLP